MPTFIDYDANPVPGDAREHVRAVALAPDYDREVAFLLFAAYDDTPVPCAYENAGGTGDRTGSIVVGGSLGDSSLVNGDTVSGGVHVTITRDGEFLFDFGSVKEVCEITFYQNSNGTHGTWFARVTNDLEQWNTVLDDTTFGGNTINVITLADTYGARYLHLWQREGETTSGTDFREFEFKLRPASAYVGTPYVLSYDNIGGRGDRSTQITITTNLTGNIALPGSVDRLITGRYDDHEPEFFQPHVSQNSGYILLQFPTPRNITEFRWRQQLAIPHGTWQWKVSTDGVSYSNIGSAFTLGNATTQLHDVSDNLGFYEYYKMELIGGNTGLVLNYWLELECLICEEAP